jgi:phosphatidylinositol glycan class T
MSIDVRPVCPKDGGECVIQMEQTVDMVLSIPRAQKEGQDPIPRPLPLDRLPCDGSKGYTDGCYPLDMLSDDLFTLSGVFGKQMQGTCLQSEGTGPETESVCFKMPFERELHPLGLSVAGRRGAFDSSTCFTLPDTPNIDFWILRNDTHRHAPLYQPFLHAERSMTGHGQERGGIATTFTNPSDTSTVDFVYLETLPWFMKPYLSTLHVSSSSPSQPNRSSIITEIHYRPGLDRARGTQLEIRMRISPSSTLLLTYDFDKAILRYTEYPPDANRGFDVAPAVVRILTVGGYRVGEENFLRTTSLLLPLPTPDFSMPYNVIILTSTIIALTFGNIFNVLVRQFVGAEEAVGGGVAVTLLARLQPVRAKLQAVVRSVKGAGAAVGAVKKTQ